MLLTLLALSTGSRVLSFQLSDLQQQRAAERSRLEQKVSELETRLVQDQDQEQQPSADLAAEVRRSSMLDQQPVWGAGGGGAAW